PPNFPPIGARRKRRSLRGRDVVASAENDCDCPLFSISWMSRYGLSSVGWRTVTWGATVTVAKPLPTQPFESVTSTRKWDSPTSLRGTPLRTAFDESVPGGPIFVPGGGLLVGPSAPL